MFGITKKIKKAEDAPAQPKRPSMSDIVPRAAGAAPLPPPQIAARRDLPLKIEVNKKKAMSADASIADKKSRAVKEAPQEEHSLPAFWTDGKRAAHAESRHGDKFNFLTKRPIDDDHLPKLPEKPGFISKFKDKWRKIFASRAEESGAILETIGESRWKAPGLTAIAIVISAVGLGTFALSAFSSIEVNIVPREAILEVDKTFHVAKNGGDLAGEMMMFKQATEESKETTGSLEANSKARGRIVVYNAYSSASQILVKRTRFETPTGKVFRITEGVVVPGMTEKNGETIPGSIEVDVVADQSGEDYNIGLADFTIPGFKGTARYTKFYGRSKTPMAGGSVSSQRVTAKGDVEELKIILAPRLEAEIMSAYKTKIPEGFILLNDAYSITYGEAQAVPPVDGGGEKVTVSLAGDFRGLLFKEEFLGKAITAAYAKSDMTNATHLANAEELNIMVTRKDLDRGEMTIHVSGKARFIWNVDADHIKNDFLAKKPIAEIFGAYKGVEKADVRFWPSWWRYVPKDGKRINVRIIER